MDKKNFYTLSWEVGNFIIAFLLFVIIYSLFLNFRLPNYIAIFLIAITAFGLSFWLYKKLVYSLIIALIITELFWTLLFLPLAPLTTSAILLIVYYTVYELQHKRKIWLNLGFAITAFILLFSTSKWSLK